MSDQQQSTTQAFPSSDQQQSSTQAFVKKTAAQRKLYESGNELAAYAAKQINYHIMGYYPITPSTQIAENLDLSGARGEHNIRLIAAEGEHSAAGICYGASAGGGRVFNALIFWAYPLTWGISSVIFLYLFLRGKWVYGFEKS